MTGTSALTPPRAPRTPGTSRAARTPRAARTSRGAALAVLRTETILFRREPAALFWIIGFPSVLLGILGSIPAFRAPDPNLGGIRFIDAYVPVSVLLAMILAGLQAMPPVITGYRERGILRRMSTTPVRPSALLGAQMGLHGAAALLSALLSLTVGRVAFGVALPGQLVGYALALVLAILAALALGALVAAVSRTQKIAQAVGSAVFFPMMFSAGVWLPVQAMPTALARIVEVTPFGAAAQALGEAAAGHWPGWTHLGVLAVWTVLLSAGATRWFRWQ
ncbi:ABC transporter permease [Streptomyces sp. NBC_00536]|uniref:ABC transporter permease n=1 Tax=Streptomyces sp. NBC_00536 TaxID=2975769 RepID=UPI002E8212D4|nr:ABC transporter permease [Streptomyces sp. NBC_00536]WUC77190.1 ABC transporter permease [Streptomyces sp. NBC_00536]